MLFLNSLFYFIIIINILIGVKESSSFVKGSEETVSSNSICDTCKTMKCNEIPKQSIDSKICCEICLNQDNKDSNNNNNESFNVDNNKPRPTYIEPFCESINCSSIVYSYLNEKNLECPSDSQKEVTTVQEETCCSVNYKCVCKKCEDQIDQCKGLNSDRRLTSKGENIPNKCCDKYTCQTQNASCHYNGKFYPEGSEWKPTKCKRCTCERSITKCREDTCPKLDCKFTIVPKSDCCPVCRTDCYSSNGTLYRNNEEWLEDDDCAICICKAGERICSIEQCRKPLCDNPIKLPGVCCKYCPEKEVQQFKYPPHCNSNLKCNLTCKNNGFKLHNRCPICECASKPIEKCSFPCDKGLAYMPLDDRLCECTNQCQTKCSQICPIGYQKGPDGCDICKCNEIPKSQPKQDCHENTTKNNTWFDSCRRCYCHNKKEYCSLISCNITCKNPIYIKNSCCPICPENNKNIQSNDETISSITCRSSTQKDDLCLENETWNIDKYTKCICREGVVYCEVSVCMAGTCPVPKYDQNDQMDDQSCCHTCNANQFINSTFNLLINKTLITPHEIAAWDCYDPYDHQKPHGARWKENDCLHCVCDNGERKCYQEKCDLQLNCKKFAYRKGQCCPYCIDFVKSACILKTHSLDNLTTIFTSTLKPSTTNVTTIVLIVFIFIIVILTIIVILLICYIINKHNESNSSTCRLTSSSIIAKNMINGTKNKSQWHNEEEDDFFDHSNKSPKYYKKNGFDLSQMHRNNNNNSTNNNNHSNNYNHLKQKIETKIINENGVTTKLLNGDTSLHSLNKANNGNIIVYV